MTLAAREGTRVWFAQGLYHDYHRLDQVIQNLPGPVKVDRAVHFKVGQHPTGFQDASFPKAEALAQYDLVIIADVNLLTFRVPERDRLRGWVQAGGRLLMLGGPYGFVTIAPLGDASDGQTAFWDWPQWPLLMTTVVKELIE